MTTHEQAAQEIAEKINRMAGDDDDLMSLSRLAGIISTNPTLLAAFKELDERDRVKESNNRYQIGYDAGERSMLVFIEKGKAEKDELRARIAELEKDEARLDWCDRNPLPDFSQVGNDSGWDIRYAIDKSMESK